MELQNLKKHIRHLATLEPTEAPVLSCYLNLEAGLPFYRQALDEQISALRLSLRGAMRKPFEEALGHIESFIATELTLGAKGAALFARGGKSPFFLPLQFRAPLPSWMAVYPTPNIFHLVELKDNYHRFVVLLASEEHVRIMEVNLGEVTEEIWRERPDLRDRVTMGWSKEQYQHHRKTQTEQFIQEKIKLLDRLMASGGHTHLLLAGEPRMTARLKQALPKHLLSKLIDTIVASQREKISDIVASTISAFVVREEMESLAVVEQLQRELNTGGLAAAGTFDTLNALLWGQADVLVMAKSYEAPAAWRCAGCGMQSEKIAQPKHCPQCGGESLQAQNLKEEMLRLAEKNGVKVEIVLHSELLQNLGGVGCLLRYRMS